MSTLPWMSPFVRASMSASSIPPAQSLLCGNSEVTDKEELALFLSTSEHKKVQTHRCAHQYALKHVQIDRGTHDSAGAWNSTWTHFCEWHGTLDQWCVGFFNVNSGSGINQKRFSVTIFLDEWPCVLQNSIQTNRQWINKAPACLLCSLQMLHVHSQRPSSRGQIRWKIRPSGLAFIREAEYQPASRVIRLCFGRICTDILFNQSSHASSVASTCR